MKAGDGLKNLGIVVELAAIAHGQDLPFFEVSKNMLNDDSATRKLLVFSLFGVAQRAIFRFLFGDKNTSGMDVLKPLIARIRQNRNGQQWALLLRMLKS